MTTTAFDDQFTDAPEPVRQQYSTADILRRNVADLELALRTQTERAEAAEAEMTKARKQKPVRWHVRGNYFHDGDAAILFASMNSMCGAKVEQLYAASVPAPAAPELDPMTRLIVSDPKQLKPKQEPAVPQNELVAAITVYLKADDEMHQATRRTGFGGMGKPVASEAEQRRLAAIRHAARGDLEALLQSARGAK